MIRICFVKLARNILSQTKVMWEGKNIYTALINRRIANIFLKVTSRKSLCALDIMSDHTCCYRIFIPNNFLMQKIDVITNLDYSIFVENFQLLSEFYQSSSI